MTATKTNQVLDFLYKNEGKLTTIEFETRFNFFMVNLNALHIQKETDKTVIISDKKDDPNLARAEFLVTAIEFLEVNDIELALKYQDGSKVLISVY